MLVSYFNLQDICEVKREIRGCSVSFIIREVQIKATVKYKYTSLLTIQIWNPFGWTEKVEII